jgi:hypothetical protein
MSSPYYAGSVSTTDILGAGQSRYFYGLRRDDEGMLYFGKVDQIAGGDDSVIINVEGLTENNFEEFEYGVDFFDGRLEEDHSRPFSNLYWDQFRWDNKNISYYINAEGIFVVRVNQAYTYPVGSQIS